MTAWAKYQAKHRRKLMREMNVGEVVRVKTKKEVLLYNEYGGLRASPSSCPWIIAVAGQWMDDHPSPCIYEDEGKFFIGSGDGRIEQPIEFCPGCGRKLEVRDG